MLRCCVFLAAAGSRVRRGVRTREERGGGGWMKGCNRSAFCCSVQAGWRQRQSRCCCCRQDEDAAKKKIKIKPAGLFLSYRPDMT